MEYFLPLISYSTSRRLDLWCIAALKKGQKLGPWCWAKKKKSSCSCDYQVHCSLWHPDFLTETMRYLKDRIRQSIPGHQGLKSSTNWPRGVEETLLPETIWSLSLYRPMTALAGLSMVRSTQPGLLGSRVALQPLALSSERLNMALVCCDSSGDGPAGGNRDSNYEWQLWVTNLGSVMISIPFFFNDYIERLWLIRSNAYSA